MEKNDTCDRCNRRVDPACRGSGCDHCHGDAAPTGTCIRVAYELEKKRRESLEFELEAACVENDDLREDLEERINISVLDILVPSYAFWRRERPAHGGYYRAKAVGGMMEACRWFTDAEVAEWPVNALWAHLYDPDMLRDYCTAVTELRAAYDAVCAQLKGWEAHRCPVPAVTRCGRCGHGVTRHRMRQCDLCDCAEYMHQGP